MFGKWAKQAFWPTEGIRRDNAQFSKSAGKWYLNMEIFTDNLIYSKYVHHSLGVISYIQKHLHILQIDYYGRIPFSANHKTAGLKDWGRFGNISKNSNY